MGKLFGGSSSSNNYSNQSGNHAYDYLQGAFSPVVNQGVQAGGAVSSLLGGDPTGFNAFKNATGFDATTQLGSQGITGNAAAAGLLRSGGTAKALQNYGDTMQNQYAGNYLSQLLGLAGLGNQAGSLIGSAGQYSQGSGSGTSDSKSGLGGLLGGIGSRIAMSDRRLKKNIHEIGVNGQGLKLYEFSYIWEKGDEPNHVGVMADEVKQKMPEAVGRLGNYDTVNYSTVEVDPVDAVEV